MAILDTNTGELVYAVRIKGNTFDPPVYENGTYRILVGDDERGGYKEFKGLKPSKQKGGKKLDV